MLNIDGESRMHAHIEEHNSKIKVPQRDLLKNPYTREEIENKLWMLLILEKVFILLMTKNITIYRWWQSEWFVRFSKEIPSFAKQVDIHLKPPRQLKMTLHPSSSTGKPSELKPYIQDAENHAKVVITKGEAERVSIKPYENVKTNYRNICLLYCQKNGLITNIQHICTNISGVKQWEY